MPGRSESPRASSDLGASAVSAVIRRLPVLRTSLVTVPRTSLVTLLRTSLATVLRTSLVRVLLLLALTLAAACHTAAPSPAPTVDRQPDPSPALTVYRPSQDLGPLFHDVQTAGVFEDSKTFVDAWPLLAPEEIATRYASERLAAEFSLPRFVERYFALPGVVGEDVDADTSRPMETHIRTLWPVLTRSADDPEHRSTLLPLPYQYVVPGGRFREVYYWDSYFTMLGLVESDRTDLVKSMLDNFAHLIRLVGHVPNANRTYYLGRSQPPYFAAMVGLYAQATDTAQAYSYLDALEAEHAFWMDGGSTIAPGEAHRRVVRLRNGALLNRYWDDFAEPRPESYREDEALGRTLSGVARSRFYRNVRAAAESGWDFSSRWMRDPSDLRSLETVDIIPIDLNSLLYHSERTIAALRRHRGEPADSVAAVRWEQVAAARRHALLELTWDPATSFFYDARWTSGERVTDRPTMAAAAVLYFGLATEAQAGAVAARLERAFLRTGGFVSTLITSGQQWDAPNGWPPLQWLGIQGLRRYGQAALADSARARWLAINRRTYRATGRMMEKYDVLDPTRPAGGGEYPTQDGFGWTNGVALALIAQEQRNARPLPHGGAPATSRRATRAAVACCRPAQRARVPVAMSRMWTSCGPRFRSGT